MTTPLDSRQETLLHLERGAVWVRYTAFIVLAPLFLTEPPYRNLVRNLAIISTTLVLHHAFVQAVLWTRRHYLFQTPLNLLVYLAEASVIVGVMNIETSPSYALYLFIIIGAGLYTTRTWPLVLITAATIAAYGAVLLVHWKTQSATISLALAAARMTAIALCAWTVSVVGRLLRQREKEATSNAEKLATTQAALHAVFSIADGPVLLYGDNLLIKDANAKACAFAGLSHGDIVGRPVFAVLLDEDAQDDPAGRACFTEEFRGERACVDAAGRPRTLDCHVHVFEDGERRLYALAATDITEQRGIQEAAQEARIGLAQENRELKQSRELAAERFAATACRSISPLTAAQGYLDMLLCEELGALTPEQCKALRVCRRETAEVCRLMEEALEPAATPAEKPSE
ncbi:MAG: PAS domain-containing protein [Nitrospiraceae bacterium]|nr:PAS domain-containing protein [Nitrospiraceae bacterium]